MSPPASLEKLAWSWVQEVDDSTVSQQNLLSAYRVNAKVCLNCRRNVKGNPNCLSGLGEKEWLKGIPAESTSLILRENDLFIGLKNLGATCYANAFLQLWYHMKELRERVLLWKPPTQDFMCDPGNNVSSMMFCLQEVFAMMKFSKKKYADPTILLDCLLLDNSVQQDANEFSKLFMCKLENLQSVNGTMNVFEEFGGHYDYVTKCEHCGGDSHKRSRFTELPLNLNNDLHASIIEFLKEEKLRGDNQFMCVRCACKRDATRAIQLVQLPDTLAFQLLRFEYDIRTQSRRKVTTDFHFPVFLDMSPYISSPESTYDLYAVLSHDGINANSGHYTALIYSNNHIIKCNDQHVCIVGDSFLSPAVQTALREEENAVYKASRKEKKNNNNNQINNNNNKYLSSYNAYTLVYRRHKTREGRVKDVEVGDLQASLQQKLQQQQNILNQKLQKQQFVKEKLIEKQEAIQELYNCTERDASKCEWVPTNDIKLLFASSYVPINNNNNNGDNEINNNNNCDNDIMNHNGSSKDEFISKDDTKKDSDNKENEEEEEEEEDGKDSITQDIYCRHSKLRTEVVVKFKLVPSKVLEKLSTFHNFTTRLKCTDHMCEVCVKEHSNLLRRLARLSNHYKLVQSLAKNSMDGEWLVGRWSWKNWKKMAESTFKKVGDEEDNEYGDEDYDSSLFNKDLLCSHGGLRTDALQQRRLKDEVWNIMKEYFISCPAFRVDQLHYCSLCLEQQRWKEHDSEVRKTQAIKLKEALPELYNNKNRPSIREMKLLTERLNVCLKEGIISVVSIDSTFQLQLVLPTKQPLKPHQLQHTANQQMTQDLPQQKVMQQLAQGPNITLTPKISHPPPLYQPPTLNHNTALEATPPKDYDLLVKSISDFNRKGFLNRVYFLPHTFLSSWKKNFSVEGDPMRNLLCHHALLPFNPLNLCSHIVVSDQEWHQLTTHVEVSQHASMQIIYTNYSFVITSTPGMCEECQKEQDHTDEHTYTYRDAVIYVLMQNEEDGHEEEEGDGRKRQMPPLGHPINKKPMLSSSECFTCVSSVTSQSSISSSSFLSEGSCESSVKVRKSSRKVMAREAKKVSVSSCMTLRQLNFELFRLFEVFKSDQVLLLEGRQLVGDDCTLSQLRVYPGCLLTLQVNKVVEGDGREEACKQEMGFRGTGLAG